MRKQKHSPNQSQIIPTLEELTRNYDRAQLIGALNMLKHDLSWKLLQAALIKEYQNKVIYQMDLCKETGKQCEAAFESGCAQTMLDTATTLIDKYTDLLANKTAAVESPRPEE